jgi:hypothetical protein
MGSWFNCIYFRFICLFLFLSVNKRNAYLASELNYHFMTTGELATSV